jgi:hypothetical protein
MVLLARLNSVLVRPQHRDLSVAFLTSPKDTMLIGSAMGGPFEVAQNAGCLRCLMNSRRKMGSGDSEVGLYGGASISKITNARANPCGPLVAVAQWYHFAMPVPA